MSDPAARPAATPSRPRSASDVDVRPARIRALVASRVPLTLVADLTGRAPTAADLLHDEAASEPAGP